MMRRILPNLIAAFLAAGAAAQETPAPYPATPATPPGAAADTFQVLDGFRMVPVAAAPEVTDPVAIAYDEFGRAFVAEMNDYPYTDKAAHKPAQENPTDASIGKIRLLEDTDGDGTFDRSTVFAENFSWPTGVVCWKGGIFVIATPDLWYLKDSDGDGKADIRRQVYTGFRKYNVQAVVNTPVWGLDHHIYISGSTNGGELTKPDAPGTAPLSMSRHDLRFDPATETLELESGYGRYGNTFDDFGNRFICNIRTPALHVVVPRRYLTKNPFIPPQRGIEDIGDFGDFMPVHRLSPPEAWRVERAERWAREEPDRHPQTELVGAGAVTSSSGITIYRGDAYPEPYRGQLFVADVSSNLFYRLALTPAGVSFKGTRIDKDADFVASRDVWFRPVNLANAPDGCLHVADMYREAIEHPWSIPDDIHARIDLQRGLDEGRIWRLEPPGFVHRPAPRLGDRNSAELVALLEHRNAWHRETAHRLLFERQDPTAIPPLRNLFRESKSALGCVHALYTLAGLSALGEAEIEAGLRDGRPSVREHTLRLAESHAAADPAIAEMIVRSLGDPDPRVRFQAILSLQSAQHVSLALHDLETLCRRDGADPWFEVALLQAATDVACDLLAALLRPHPNPPAHSLVRNLAFTVAAGNEETEITETIHAIAGNNSIPPERRVAAAAGLADGLKRNRLNLFRVAGQIRTEATFRESILADAARLVADASQPFAFRSTALTLFRSASFDEAAAVYATLLAPAIPPELQNTAIQSLSAFSDPRVATILLDAWPRLSPQVRQQALESLLTRSERLAPLLESMESGVVSPHLVTRARRDFLTSHRDATIAAKAKTIFAPGDRPREDIVAHYRESTGKLKGNAKAGETVFTQTCIACHRAGDEGFSDLGPNLSTIAQWDRDQILVNVLDPNREVSPAFIEYLIEKKDASVVSGAVLNETAAAVLLRLPDGTRKAVYRRDIASIKNTGLSLMPEGLDAVITPQQMADLIAFLKRP